MMTKASELFTEIERVVPAIDGWCVAEKACDFAAIILALRPEVSCEIGVWGGRGTFAMALAHRFIGKGKVIAVDPWKATDSVLGQEGANAAWWSDQPKHDLVYRRFMANVKAFELEPWIDVRRQRSDEFTLPAAAGLIVTDGNHGEQAIADVERLAPIVPTGGIIYLDDLNWSGGHVQGAAARLLAAGFVELFKRDQGAFFQRT